MLPFPFGIEKPEHDRLLFFDLSVSIRSLSFIC